MYLAILPLAVKQGNNFRGLIFEKLKPSDDSNNLAAKYDKQLSPDKRYASKPNASILI